MAQRPFVFLAKKATENLFTPQRSLVWRDFSLAVFNFYLSLACVLTANKGSLRMGIGLFALTLTAIRVAAFAHEVVHLADRVPGLRLAWDIAVGIPTLNPSCFSFGVHNQHHDPVTYGTSADPEYVPLARWKKLRVTAFVLAALMTPCFALLRFVVLTPLSLLYPSLRAHVLRRWSARAFNPAYTRLNLGREEKRRLLLSEIAIFAWLGLVVSLTVTGVISWQVLAFCYAVAVSTSALSRLRLISQHRYYDDDGQPDLGGQFADSHNYAPGLLGELFAPFNASYHALHHLLPDLPYGQLSEADQRLGGLEITRQVYLRGHPQARRQMASQVRDPITAG